MYKNTSYIQHMYYASFVYTHVPQVTKVQPTIKKPPQHPPPPSPPHTLQWRHNEGDGVSASRLFTQPFIQGADQIKHQSSASLAFLRGIHRWPVSSPHKGPVTRKMFPFDDAIMHTHCLWIQFITHMLISNFVFSINVWTCISAHSTSTQVLHGCYKCIFL